MPSGQQEKSMASNIVASSAQNPDDDESRRNKDEPRKDYRPPAQPMAQQLPSGSAKHSFFTIYKPGQGYWTRLGTVAGAGLLGAIFTYRLYTELMAWTDRAVLSKTACLGIAGGFLAAFVLFVYWVTNKPRNVDFLIATDSEMKKVNWTTRKELIGSTKVVIFFMFLIAFLLFVIDLFFGYFFWMIDVLKSRPF